MLRGAAVNFVVCPGIAPELPGIAPELPSFYCIAQPEGTCYYMCNKPAEPLPGMLNSGGPLFFGGIWVDGL